MIDPHNCICLPQWLDDYIFNQLKASYCRINKDMVVLHWDKAQLINYLGTYFPRSYTESYCIFKRYFLANERFSKEDSLTLLDFGCGTGGEIIGLAMAITDYRPNIKSLKVKAIEGNKDALDLFIDIKDTFNKHHILQIDSTPSPVKIDDIYDLGILDGILAESRYDLIVSFKAVCEFVTKQEFADKNAYEHLVKFMLPKLTDLGIMLLVDVSSKNEVAQEWLPDLMDQGIQKAKASVIARNQSNNESFMVRHSHQKNDISKIAWRLITSK